MTFKGRFFGLRNRVMESVGWSILGSAISQVGGLVAAAMTARFLGAALFGQLSIVVVTVTVFAVFAVGGLGMTATRFISTSRESNPLLAGQIIGLSDLAVLGFSLPVAVALALAAPALAGFAFGDSAEAEVLTFAGSMVVASAFFSVYTGALSGFEAFRSVAFTNGVRAIVLITGLWLMQEDLTLRIVELWYAASWLLAATAARVRLHHIAARHGVRISYRLGREHLRILRDFSLPALVAGLTFTPANWVASALLARRAGLSEVGIFNAANQWQTAMLFFTTSLGNLALPMLSNAFGKRDYRMYIEVLKTNLKVVVGATLLAAVGIVLAAPLLLLPYGPEFIRAQDVIYIVALAAILTAVATPLAHVVWSLGAARGALVLSLVRAGLLIMFTAMLAGLGAIGLAWAYVLMNATLLLLSVPYAKLLVQKAPWSGIGMTSIVSGKQVNAE